MKVELRNVKYAAFASEETPCFDASVYIDSKRAGVVSNSGKGGPHRFHFDDRAKLVAFESWCREQPPLPADPSIEGDKPLPMDAELYVSTLLEDHLWAKQVGRLCKTSTLFRLKGDKAGEYRTIKVIYSDRVRNHLMGKYGADLLEIANDRGAVPCGN